MPEQSENENELTHRMRQRYAELHRDGVTNVYDVMTELASVVRLYDAEVRAGAISPANQALVERDGGLNPS